MWASDGSMKPASVTMEDEKVVLGAPTGPSMLVLKIPGHNISILHGEQIGLITALILAGQISSDTQQQLLTDHPNCNKGFNSLIFGIYAFTYFPLTEHECFPLSHKVT